MMMRLKKEWMYSIRTQGLPLGTVKPSVLGGYYHTSKAYLQILAEN